MHDMVFDAAYSARIKVSVVTESSTHLYTALPPSNESSTQLRFVNSLQRVIAALAGVSTGTVMPFCDASILTG